ncbi:LacI family transcriptional regulator [Muricauda sp. SCSIO 64092]|uniref:substrate-binding domain-containing protein n=1 Tax=Allomuricauda sp. SCSIO 64092 TaxID=2908842 RepID=UPI001FF29C51|nr:LacI family DNA-binding transcriptional regulator [Muricauda sp. SCSIO 64092]UOY04873.1 LacI family transcriptional regulator [Muricauda sp. SCSIO 64092]
MKKKYSLKDIAERSGVSVGTVDRVIHKRGRVSKESIEKVSEALKELNYTPNPVARSLRNNKHYKINVLIPDPKKDSYWIPCEKGIEEVIMEFRAFNLQIDVQKYSPSSPRSFASARKEILRNNPDAILFVPLFDKESELLLKKLNKMNITTVTFNSPPRKGNNKFVGQDLFLSGRVAAKLIQKSIPSSSEIAIIHIDESINNSIHMQNKEKGFKNYFESENDNRHIHVLTTKTEEIEISLENLLEENPNLQAFFVTTSKSYKVVNAIEKLGIQAKVVGYDLLEENINYLLNGSIEYLIHQMPKLQASISLRGIIENLLFNKVLFHKQLLPIEIINSENVKSYL